MPSARDHLHVAAVLGIGPLRDLAAVAGPRPTGRRETSPAATTSTCSALSMTSGSRSAGSASASAASSPSRKRAASQSAWRQPGPMSPLGAPGQAAAGLDDARDRRCARSRRSRRPSGSVQAAQARVDDDAERRVQSGALGELGARRDAAREHEQVAGDVLAVGGEQAVEARVGRPRRCGTAPSRRGCGRRSTRPSAATARRSTEPAPRSRLRGIGCGPWCTTATPRARVRRGEGELEAEHAGAEHDDPLPVGDGVADARRRRRDRAGPSRRGGAASSPPGDAVAPVARGTPSSVGTFAREPVASTTRS